MVWSILAFLIGAIVIGVFGVKENAVFTYEGLWISVYGVLLTFIQVSRVKKTTEATEEAIKTTRTHMDHLLSISDISKHVAYLRFVKECVTNDKMEMARLRLGDIKDFMTKIGYIRDLDIDQYKHGRLINTLEANLNCLDQDINQTQKVDKVVFCNDLEKVASFLMSIENELKAK